MILGHGWSLVFPSCAVTRCPLLPCCPALPYNLRTQPPPPHNNLIITTVFHDGTIHSLTIHDKPEQTLLPDALIQSDTAPAGPISRKNLSTMPSRTHQIDPSSIPLPGVNTSQTDSLSTTTLGSSIWHTIWRSHAGRCSILTGRRPPPKNARCALEDHPPNAPTSCF